jgi:acetyl esterase
MWSFWRLPRCRSGAFHLVKMALGLATITSVLSTVCIARPVPQTSVARQVAPPQTDPQVTALLGKMVAAGVLHPTTVDQVRRAYLFYPTLSGKPEEVFRVTNRSIPGLFGYIPIRVYAPGNQKELPVFVFFHGGGFVAGSLDTHDTPLRAIANRCGCVVVSVGYRLAPDHPYPAAIDDAYAATLWVADHAAEIQGDSHRIAVGGDGAGGNLAAVVGLMARDRRGPYLAYQVLIYPDLDALTLGSRYESKDPILGPEARAAVLGAYVPLTTNLQDPYISPVFAQSFKSLPPALVITDADDPTRDEGQLYAKELQSAGVPVRVSSYPNMIHGFFLMAGELDAGKQAIDEISAALRAVFTPNGKSAAPGSQGESQ